MQRILSQIGRSQRLAVLNIIKRTPDGLAVKPIAQRLEMSYMGVKQICLDLEREGYLDTFRKNRGIGRPELLYRLTSKAGDLFPRPDNALALSLLAQAGKLFGAGAAEKILFLHFQDKTREYSERIKGETPMERAKWLTRLREQEGYMAEFSSEDIPKIVEHHHPMQALLDGIPRIAEMEREMFQKLLGTNVRRNHTSIEGEYHCVFTWV